MDQLKPIIAGMVKYHFWVLLGIVMVIALFTWNSAVGKLNDEFAKNKSAIESQFSKVQQQNSSKIELGDQPQFANQSWTDQTLARSQEVVEAVERAWQTIYAEQQQVRRWPDISPTMTGAQFAQGLERLDPTAPLPPEVVPEYRLVLEQQVAQLPELVSAEAMEFDARNRPIARDPEDMMVSLGGVKWNPQNYAAIRQRLTPPDKLTVEWVRNAQEDIWVYELFLGAIDRTNGVKGERDEFALPISRLEAINLGLEVSPDFLLAHPVDAREGISSTVRGPGGAPGAEMGMQPGGEDEDKEEEKEEPKEPGRYLHEPKVVGLRPLPVRVHVRMNLDKLPQLLLELANADLLTEVAEVYISTDENSAAGGERGGRVRGAAQPRIPRFAGAMNEEGMSPAAAGQANVEIWAIVHLADRPDPEKIVPSEDKEKDEDANEEEE